jgi:hypothetical protein
MSVSATVGFGPALLNSRPSPLMLMTVGRARSSEMRSSTSGGWSR